MNACRKADVTGQFHFQHVCTHRWEPVLLSRGLQGMTSSLVYCVPLFFFVNLIITSVRLFRFAFSFLGMFECQITCLQTLATTLIICKHKGLILCVNTYVCMFDCAMQ